MRRGGGPRASAPEGAAEVGHSRHWLPREAPAAGRARPRPLPPCAVPAPRLRPGWLLGPCSLPSGSPGSIHMFTIQSSSRSASSRVRQVSLCSGCQPCISIPHRSRGHRHRCTSTVSCPVLSHCCMHQAVASSVLPPMRLPMMLVPASVLAYLVVMRTKYRWMVPELSAPHATSSKSPVLRRPISSS